jgi:hypothetical protein
MVEWGLSSLSLDSVSPVSFISLFFPLRVIVRLKEAQNR